MFAHKAEWFPLHPLRGALIALQAVTGWILLGSYIAMVPLANWTLQTFGVVPMFGLLIPAGTLWAGLAFTLRDLVQDRLGREWTIVAIMIGAVLSAFVSPQLALASGTAFLFSELADFVVYTPLRERHWLGAVAASNVVGLIVDSVLFLLLAFGSLEFLGGQIMGKGLMTLAAVSVLWLSRRRTAKYS